VRASAIIAAVLAISLAACSTEPLDFPDWTIPVPEGTPIIEYPAVPMEERTERIELVEDLVIGREDQPEYRFYGLSDLAVDSSGRMYVLDGGNHRVQVFDHSGDYLRTLGREGQGPGELAGGSLVTVAGDRVVVWDFRNQRLSVWDLEGDHLADVRLAPDQHPNDLLGTDTGALVVRHQVRLKNLALHERFFSVSIEGEEILQYSELPVTNRIGIKASADLGSAAVAQSVRRGVSVAPNPESAIPTVGVDRDGSLYITASAEYQILAIETSGNATWALRTNALRDPFPEAEVDRLVARVAEIMPGLGFEKSMLDWPERSKALEMLQVDGHGHVYVFPYVYVPLESTIANRPVDIYSPDGERLFSGLIAERPWHAVHGDFVYSILDDPVTGEAVVVRYRLVELF